MKNLKWVFFGTDEFAVEVLETLKVKDFLPALVVTTPDRPQGRHLELTPSPAKVWAKENNISVLSPEKLKDQDFISHLADYDLFVVASYGKIIPKEVFELPKYKTLNIHPSLLPKLRGASPVATAILEDMKDTGVTIIQIDEKMDHGPIVAQREMQINEWPTREELEKTLAIAGAELLYDSITGWIDGSLEATPQEESKTTYTKMIKKEDAEIEIKDIEEKPYEIFRKILAYHGWPKAHFYISKDNQKIKVNIESAKYENDSLTIEKVTPAGKKEMSYDDFLRGFIK